MTEATVARDAAQSGTRSGATAEVLRVRRAAQVAILIALVLSALAACRGAGGAAPPPPLSRAAYAHYLAASAARFDGDPVTAVAHLRAAAAAAPDEPEIAVALIATLRQAEQSAPARLEARNALRRWPRHCSLWLAFGELLAEQRSFVAAARAFRRAIDLDCDRADPQPVLALVEALEADGQSAAALTALRRLVDRRPVSAAARYRFAQALVAREQWRPAIRELRTVLLADPGDLDARSLLARALARTGELDQAIAEARAVFDRSGEDAGFVEPVFRLLCEAGDRRAAVDLLELFDDDDRAVADLVNAIELALDIDESAVGLRLVKRVLARSAAAATSGSAAPAATAATLAAAQFAVADHDHALALEWLRSPAAARDRGESARRLAEVLLATAAPRSALDVISEALIATDIDSQQRLDLQVVAARARIAGGMAAATVRALAPVAAATATATAAELLARAEIEAALGDFGAAIAIAERAVVASDSAAISVATSVRVLHYAGSLIAEHGAAARQSVAVSHAPLLARAERYLRRARDLAPGRPALLDSWGWLRFRQGRLAEAVTALATAAMLAPRQADVAFHLGVARAARGQSAPARVALERALSLRPTAPIRRAAMEALEILIRPRR
jgi:tetratricopeptide (TPR) repeat protein